MTREEAIRKMEFCKNAYQKLIDEEVDNGTFVGTGVNGVWKADTPLTKAYSDMVDACDMAIKALEQNESAEEWYKLFVEKLEQEPKTGHWISLDDFRGKYNENGFMCSKCGEHSDFEENFCPNCGCRMVEPRESEDKE